MSNVAGDHQTSNTFYLPALNTHLKRKFRSRVRQTSGRNGCSLPHGFPGCGSSLLPFDTIRQSVCLVETPGEHVAQDFLLRFQVSAGHNFENKKGQLPDKGFTFPSSAFTTHLAVLGLMEREPTCCANSVIWRVDRFHRTWRQTALLPWIN